MADFDIRDGVLCKYNGTETAVVIPEGVTKIRESAFKGCGSLTSLTIPVGVTEIGFFAFGDCANLTAVAFPDGLKEIGDYAFHNCANLTAAAVPDGVTKIGDSAFEGCSRLGSVPLPDSVRTIGVRAFSGTAYAADAKNREDGVLYIGRHLIAAEKTVSGAYTVRTDTLTIAGAAFSGCADLASVALPNGVTTVESRAFLGCVKLSSIALPDGLTKIGERAFYDTAYYNDPCNWEGGGLYIGRHLIASETSLSGAYSVRQGTLTVGDLAFSGRKDLTSVEVPNGVTAIGRRAFEGCRSLRSVVLPDSVTELQSHAFYGCASLTAAPIPDGVTKIGRRAFCRCESLTSVRLPDGVGEIGEQAFSCCKRLRAVAISGAASIGEYAFSCCPNLTSVVIPNGVTIVGRGAFDRCPAVTVVCGEKSPAHRYCRKYRLTHIFDYQFEAFHGVLPPGLETLSSPFLADEEQPYVFVSYSHKDRDAVLSVIKTLYEAGWRIWYDEGLTIGDRYDETLEEHVKNCAAFLLFATAHSRESLYVREHEIPWAIAYKKPIVACAPEAGIDFDLPGGTAPAAVSPAELEAALTDVPGLVKGERRTAKGITVAVDPAERADAASGDGFAYCLYAGASAAKSKAILLEAKKAGCNLYDAAESGGDAELLQKSACLIVFMDKAFLSDARLTETLARAYEAGRDIAVCQLEALGETELPENLRPLYEMQWLVFTYGLTKDMHTRLARHLQKRGCRNTSVLPGFTYEKTEEGIVITGYAGFDPTPAIEREYGGIPVVKIADRAFANRIHLKKLAIPDGVTEIGAYAFRGCANLASVNVPDGVSQIERGAFAGCARLPSVRIPLAVTKIGASAFQDCVSLDSVNVPDGVSQIEKGAFAGCKSLTAIRIPDGVTTIGSGAFHGCASLNSVALPRSVTKIESFAFAYCAGLTAVAIPDGVTEIGLGAFKDCTNLTSFAIPDGVTKIGSGVFSGCENLTSVTIPAGVTEIGSGAFKGCTSLLSIAPPASVTKIAPDAFAACPNLTISGVPGSAAHQYAVDHNIPFTAI